MATADTSQAGIMLHSNRHGAARHGVGLPAARSAHPPWLQEQREHEGWEVCVGGAQDSGPGGAHPVLLYASTVVRAIWAFAMQGCHDDPVLPLLVPHALVRAATPTVSILK